MFEMIGRVGVGEMELAGVTGVMVLTGVVVKMVLAAMVVMVAAAMVVKTAMTASPATVATPVTTVSPASAAKTPVAPATFPFPTLQNDSTPTASLPCEQDPRKTAPTALAPESTTIAIRKHPYALQIR